VRTDKPMKRRLPKLAGWLASIYLVWSLLVFFGSLGSERHSWWPMFLYPVIWPLSLLFQLIGSASSDAVAATFYIVIGTIWIWLLGRLFSIVATRVFPFRNENPAA
jgi:hypothetical protein